ncbi:MAG: hypothetical protein QHJ82_05090 [Verrucomicrobiota bacterium]|nr:hypothetical protein [Verrucomicrobiota bacterium]
MMRVYLDEYRFRADHPYGPETGPNDLGMMLDDDLGRALGGEFQLTHHWREHVLTVGGEMRDHLRQNQATYWVVPMEVLLDHRRCAGRRLGAGRCLLGWPYVFQQFSGLGSPAQGRHRATIIGGQERSTRSRPISC